jgi:uncharacterized protein YbcC (UPF0753/DUF2309 family)
LNQTDRAELKRIVAQAAELLPAQGPLSAFVFLNPLQALEELPFDEGVLRGASLFGCKPYLTEHQYREKMDHGRIGHDDVEAVLREDLGPRGEERIADLVTRRELRMAMLQYPLRFGPPEELRWFVAETDALARFREEMPSDVRETFLRETRYWVMRDLRAPAGNGNGNGESGNGDGGNGNVGDSLSGATITETFLLADTPRRQRPVEAEAADLGAASSDTAHPSGPPAGGGKKADDTSGVGRRGPRDLLSDVLVHFDENRIDDWTEKTWEAVSLQALWRTCRSGVRGAEFVPASPPPLIRHRDMLRDTTHEDADSLIHPVLVRYSAAYCDQGFAAWPLPHREEGYLRAFCRLYGPAGGTAPELWMRGLAELAGRALDTGADAAAVVAESLEDLGVGTGEQEDFLTAELLAMRGWAGMIWQMEVRGDRVPVPAPAGTLMEYLAVRLLLERVALAHVAAETLGYRGPLSELREALLVRRERFYSTSVEQRALIVFQIAELLGWPAPRLAELNCRQWSDLVVECEAFSGLERRRIFHRAFERHYRRQALDALSIHTARPHRRVEGPKFQASFCIDAREESFRRHLEEIDPQVETFAAPGFFCIPIYYRGVADAHYSTLCPIVVRPKHWVVEEVALTLEEEHRRRAETRRRIGQYTHGVHRGTRSLAGGVLTAMFGVLASIPLIVRVLFPGLAARVRKRAERFVEPPPVTRLRLERIAADPSPDEDGIGFTLAEMSDFGERVLRDIGLIDNFARLVMFFGHGSSCLNNPHKSAYDCGACSGSAGSPNARALAAMLNHPSVRQTLAERGLKIPSTTFFIGGLHNTAEDSITFLDLDRVPTSHVRDVEEARKILDKACDRNSHERCRRFYSAPLTLSPSAAHRHARQRAEDLAQTRPEFGNASNAMVFVGRRSRVKGLFMDRRAFMHSYEPDQDDAEATILGRILGPVVVVCSGINLQYYFSYVDSAGWGAGTKLPHNVTSLLGVMDGHAGDLRMGLPWQGVEIHEPVRLLMVFETRPELMLKIMGRNALVDRIIRNGWAQLALLDPDSNRILEYRNGEFVPYEPATAELPRAESSADWYRGWREHLGFAQIESKSNH